MMDRRRMIMALLAGSCPSITNAGEALAQTQAITPARNVVLVHGLYADGSSWLNVIPHLRRARLNVTAVQNPLLSLGRECELTPRTLALHDGPTDLVWHSY